MNEPKYKVDDRIVVLREDEGIITSSLQKDSETYYFILFNDDKHTWIPESKIRDRVKR